MQMTTAKPQALRGKWGAQDDGTIVNPIVPADYSDIDAIRIGARYVAISSTIHTAPGMVVLASGDMVNWQTVGHAVSDVAALDPELGWDRLNRYGRGVWAGAIRHHLGRYFIYFTTPDTGLFVTTAADIAGPWSPPLCLWATAGYDDPCPFWDADGTGWLAITRFSGDSEPGIYTIILYRLAADGLSLDPASAQPVQRSKGAEASKLYRIGEFYYLFFSHVTAEGRVPMCKRAKTIEALGAAAAVQLGHVSAELDREPNQGAFLEDGENKWWFLTHQGTGDWEGRALCLLPVTWIDGWPIIGEPGPDGIGNMVWQTRAPAGTQPGPLPDLSDDFSGTLGPQWEWNHAPNPDCWSLSERPGWLRLKAALRVSADPLGIPNILSQRCWKTALSQVEVRLSFEALSIGQKAGLCHLSHNFRSLVIRRLPESWRLQSLIDGNVTTLADFDAPTDLWLASTWTEDGMAQFSWRLGTDPSKPAGVPFALTWSHYRGDRVGLFTTADHAAASGHADFSEFHYAIASQTGRTR